MYDYIYFFRSRDVKDNPKTARETMNKEKSPEQVSSNMVEAIQSYLFGKDPEKPPKADEGESGRQNSNAGQFVDKRKHP
jgi:hypothetical protein